MYHPWREFRGRESVTLRLTRFPDERHAATDGTTLWMDNRLLQVERRCAVTHEQVHMDAGHTGCQDDREEARVRRRTAEKLIDTADLIKAAQWALSAEEMADELWVTLDVLNDRVRYLSPVERGLINHAINLSRHHAD